MRRADDRKADFKKGVDSAAGRRRREETTIQLRKSKKEQQLAKRRAATNDHVTLDSKLPTLADIPTLIQTMKNPSCDPNDRLNAVRGIRRMLSVVQNPPAKQLIESGVLPALVQFLSYDKEPTLQFEAAWALTNVASTSFTMEVVNAGATPSLVRLLGCMTADVRDQAAWCLGNIAGDRPELRDYVLQCGSLPKLLQNIVNPESESLLKNVMWTISNLCRGKPQPELNLVKDCIPAIAYVLPRTANREIKSDCYWSMSYLSDGDDYRIQVVVDGQVVPYGIDAVQSDDASLVTPALRFLGNVVTGTKEQTQVVVDAGILDVAPKLLEHPRKTVRKETAWLLSNIAAGSPEQLDALFKKTTVVNTLVEMSRSAEWNTRKEAIFAVSNMFTGGTPKQVQTLVDMDGLEAMCDVLVLNDSTMVMTALSAIESALRISKEKGKSYDVYIEEYDGVTKIEDLQHHTNDKIYNLTVKILEEFFGGEEDSDENLAPGTQDGHYTFGLPTSTPTKNLFGSSQAFGMTAQSPSSQNIDMAAESPAAKFDFGS